MCARFLSVVLVFSLLIHLQVSKSPVLLILVCIHGLEQKLLENMSSGEIGHVIADTVFECFFG